MADVSAHGFWKRGITAMFDIRIARVEVGNSNAEHRGGPPLPEAVGAYVCHRLCKYYYLS